MSIFWWFFLTDDHNDIWHRKICRLAAKSRRKDNDRPSDWRKPYHVLPLLQTLCPGKHYQVRNRALPMYGTRVSLTLKGLFWSSREQTELGLIYNLWFLILFISAGLPLLPESPICQIFSRGFQFVGRNMAPQGARLCCSQSTSLSVTSSI